MGESFNIDNIVHEIQHINIIPNPNNGIFTIQGLQDLQYNTIIYSSLGHCVFEKEDLYNDTFLDLTNYPSGIYIIIIESQKKIFTKKIIIN